MRPFLKVALAFVAGLIVGAVVWGKLQIDSFERVMARANAASLNEPVLHLQFLSSEKRTNLWRDSLLESMPDLARRLDPLRQVPEYAAILWNIRLAYSLNDREVPKEIAAILSNLPLEAAPQCPLPRRTQAPPPRPATGTETAAAAPEGKI
jgi:hypothetical protein